MDDRSRYLFPLALLAFSLVAASSAPAGLPPEFLTKWGIACSTVVSGVAACDGKFLRPNGIAVDAAGKVYVADQNNDRIQKFDSTGSFLARWGSSGSSDDRFWSPTDVAVDSAGNVYIADRSNLRIEKYSSGGTFLLMWGWGVQDGSSVLQTCASGCQRGLLGSGAGQFHFPYGVAVDTSGNVYVADQYNHRIQKFDGNGALLTAWGTEGSADGQFFYPNGLEVDGSGNVYVSDTGNKRIQKFDSNGVFLTQWGPGTGENKFNNVRGLAVDASGNVYVADMNNARIQKFDSTGTLLAKWGTYGAGDGGFVEPRGVAVDASGNIYVSDSGNHRIQKFGGEASWLDLFVGEPELPGGR